MRFIALDAGKTKTVAMMFDDNLNALCSVVSGPVDIILSKEMIETNITKAISTSHIAICSGIGKIPISEVPAEFAKVLSKGSEVIIPYTMSTKLSESIAKYCKDVEKGIFT